MMRRLIVIAFAAIVGIAATFSPFATTALGAGFSSISVYASSYALTLGQSTTLTVYYSENGNIDASPAGSYEVYFSSSSTACTLTSDANVIGFVAGGGATLNWTPTTTGSFNLCALYVPTDSNDPYSGESSFPNQSVVVSAAAVGQSSFATFDIGAGSDSIVNGTSTTLTATLTGTAGVPTGTVNFYSTSDPSLNSCEYHTYLFGTVQVGSNGVATTTARARVEGPMGICAQYVPNTNGTDPYAAGIPAGPYIIIVTGSTPTIVVGASTNPVVNGASTALTAAVSGNYGVAPGSIQFFQSTNTATCVNNGNIDSPEFVNAGTGIATDPSFVPTGAGTVPICATYIPNNPYDPYSSFTTAAPYLLNVTTLPLSITNLVVTPNPAGQGFYTTLTATLSYSSIVPPSPVVFYVSSSSEGCSLTDSPYIFGYDNVSSNGTAIQFYAYAYTSGPLTICAQYNPNSGDPYGQAISAPVTLNVYQPTSFTVSTPPTVVQGAPLTFTFGLTTPSGQVPPTGTITLYDPNNYYAVIGTAIVGNDGSIVPPSVSATLSGSTYDANYSGDGNYNQQSVANSVYVINGLSTISPAAVNASLAGAPGAPGTQFTLTGPGIAPGSSVEVIDSTGAQFNFSPDSPPSTQLLFTIPPSSLQTPGELYVYLVTGSMDGGYTTTGGPVQIQVYAPYLDSATVSTSPTSIPYGTALPTSFNANVTRGSTKLDGAVPNGPTVPLGQPAQVSFTLNGTGGNTYSASLGSSTLSQVTTPGNYVSPFTEPIDQSGNGKLISADLNGDGYVDIVGLPAFNYPSVYNDDSAAGPYLQVMLSTGFDGFQAEQMVYTQCIPQDFAVGDIDGDGIPDLVVVCSANDLNPYPNELVAYYMLGINNGLGQGTGSFGPPIQFGSPSAIYSPSQVVLGQFNGDGYLDIAVIDGVNGSFQVMSPFGYPYYGPVVDISGIVEEYGPVVAAAAADFDQNQAGYGYYTDLVFENYYDEDSGSGAISVFVSEGAYNGFSFWSQSSFNASTYYLQSMTVTDVNGDGYPDVVLADPGDGYYDSGNLLVFQNDGYGDLYQNQNLTQSINSIFSVVGLPFPTIGQPAPGAAATQGWNLSYTFINNTDSNDIWIGQALYNASSYSLVPVGNPIDTGQQPYTYGDPENLPNFIVTGDMNGDGYLDLAINSETFVGLSPYELFNLQPWYYSNDAQTVLTGASQPPTPPAGTYALGLSYPGSQLYGANNTASTPIYITQVTPTGGLTVNPPSSPYPYGTSITFTETLTGVTGGAAPTGTVTFFDGEGTLGSGTVIPSGVGATSTATFTTNQLAVGSHNISLTYNGDTNYTVLSDNGAINVTINEAAFSLALSSSASTTTAGSVVTFTAQAANGVTLPAGESITVTGIPDAANVTPAINSSGVASFSYGLFPASSTPYTITATYAGDGNYLAATSNSVSLQVNPTPVTVSLTTSANPVAYPTAVGLTANASTGGLGIPTGSISFLNGSTQIGNGTLATVNNGSSGLNYLGITDSPTELTDSVVVTGDFNGDGIPDLAVLESNSGSLLISLGNGDGTFQGATTYTVDQTSVAMVAANLHSNQYSDLVIAGTDGTVTVMQATGDAAGDLTVSETLSVPFALGVAVGDFNHDGFADFAVAGLHNVTAFYNDGAGNFTSGNSWTSGFSYSNFTGITVADFNKDGFSDIALTDSTVPDVAVFMYEPDGHSFGGPYTYPVGASASAIASGDINGDGYPDLAVVSNVDSTVAVLMNYGTNPPGPGTFGPASIYGVANQPTAIVMNDFNKDGFADIAVVGTGAGQGSGTTILLGSSSASNPMYSVTGPMYGETTLPTTNDVITTGLSLATADFNGDGNPDLAVGYNGVSIFVDSAAQFQVTDTLPAGTDILTAVYTPPSPNTLVTYNPASVSEVVYQATTTVLTWPTASAISYGQTLASSTLSGGTASVTGTFAFTNPSTAPGTGASLQSVTFTPADLIDYSSTSATVSVTVNKATPTFLALPTASAITYGQTLALSTLSGGTASVIGTFAWTSPSTAPGAGTASQSVTFTPSDTTDYITTVTSVPIQVNQATPAITWTPPAAIHYGTVLSGAQLDATGTPPGGAFTYSPPAGTTLPVGLQTLRVTYAPADATDYTTTTSSVPLTVNQATPAITWAAPAPIPYGTALSATQLNATSAVAGSFVYTPASGVLTAGPHTLQVTFTPTDTTDYTTATSSVPLTVTQGTPVITWSNPAAITYGTVLSAAQLNATASTPGTFTYSPAAGTTITAGTHSLGVTFVPTDTTDYANATGTALITVNQATPVITWASPAAITYGTALSAAQLNATASTPGTFSYTPALGSILNAGTHQLSVSFIPTDGTDYASVTATASITVTQGTPVITWPNPPAITYGTVLGASQLNANASTPGTFTYTPAAGTTLTAGTHTLSVSFVPTDNTDYANATGTASITVNQATPVITWTSPAAITYGTSLSATQLNATASTPGTFTYTPAAGTNLTAGTHQLSVSFVPTDNTDYANVTGTASITVNQATSVVTWSSPAAITYGTALTATQLNATASTPGAFTYTPAAGTILTAGAHPLSVTFVPTDATDYTSATGTASITVNQATPVITWASPAAITYGTSLSAAQLNATASTPGAFTYTPTAGTVLTAGVHSLSVTFVPTDATDYTNVTGTASITVNQATPVITWTSPAAITYGTTLSATQLNATASTPGAFTYTPAAGATLTAGAHQLSVTFVPTDATDYVTTTATASITVNQGTPVITWANPAAITYGATLSATQLNATASVPGTFIYSPGLGSTLNAGTHQLSVTFTPTDNTDYANATATASITVNQATPAITWANPAGITYGTTLTATQLNATASTPGTFTYTPASGTTLTAGPHQLSVSFAPTDTTDYVTTTATVSITVNKATPNITWSNPASLTYGTALSATQLNATSSTPGTFTYTPATGTILTAGAHSLSVTFVPTDTTDYTNATGTASITVNQATPTITWTNPAAMTYGTALSTTQLSATASTPGTFTYSPSAGTILTAGPHQLSVSFVPTDAVDYLNTAATVSITVNQATTTVSWSNPTSISYGTSLSATQLNATASVPGTFTYTPAIGTVLTAGTHTLSVSFTPTDSTDYLGATATSSITVNQSIATITWPAPAAITYGTALSTTQLDATSSVPGTFSFTPAAGTVLGAGPQTLTVTFTPTDTTNSSTATASVPIQVNQATPVITWPTPAAISFGARLSGTQLDATATPTGGTFTYAPPAGTTLPEGAQTLRVTYVPADPTDYATATASVTIQVNTTSVALDLVSSTASATAGSVVTFQVQASSAASPAGQSVTLTGLPTATPVTVTLDGDGFASYSYGLFPPGSYTVQATFAGNASFTAATSNTVSLAVAPSRVQVSLTTSANPVTYPTPINLTATAGSEGLGVPTGTVSFQDNGIQVGNGTLATVNGSSGLMSVGTIDSVTGQTVTDVVTGDFNKDGNQDLAVLEIGPGVATLLISLGNGDGTFQAPTVYSSATYGVDPNAVAMATADFNGDGYTDLAVVSSDGAVAILLAAGDAAGDFTLSQTLQVPGVIALATGDFNKDGNQDVAVISANTVTVFYGTGSTPSNFPSAGSWSATFSSSNFTGITVADFNHDGYADFAVSDKAGPDVAVFLSNAGGSGFTGPQTYPVGASATAIASGDINGDGYPDLAVVSNVDSTVDVLINNGSGEPGTFPAGTIYGVASQPTSIAMNDFNKDGYADVAVAGTGTGQGGGTTILLGSSSGAMTGETSLPTANGQSIASADFNNDGNPDLTVGLNGITVFLDSAAQATASGIVLTGGTQPLTAVYSPAASSIFAAATSQAISEVVNLSGSTVTWPNPASITYGTALSSTQLDATASVPGTFLYSPPKGSVLTVGTQQLNVTFVPTDSVDYVGSTASVSITVTPAPVTISWTKPTGITYGIPLTNTQLDATALVPGTFTYTPVIGSVLTAGTHQLSVSFVPNDTLDYVGSTATVSIVVSPTATSVTWPSPASIPYGTALSSSQLDATASVPGSFAYTPAVGAVLTAGPHVLTVTFTPTDSTDYAPASSTVAITVNKAIPTVSWTAPAAISYGTALGSSQLDATASTPGSFTYTPPTGTVLGAGPQNLNVSFTPTDTTDYVGTTASVPIQVNQAVPVITWANPAAIPFGIPLSGTQLNATATPAGGVFIYTPSAGTILATGSQTLSVKYQPSDTVDYTTATASATIQVNPGLTLTSVSPSTAAFQSPSSPATPMTVTLTGTGFTSTSVVQLFWASGTTVLSSSYDSPDQLTATLPGIFFQQAQPGQIAVSNPSTGQSSASIAFTITPPPIQLVFTGPGSQSEGQQPSLNLQFLEGYPIPLEVTSTITVQPQTPGGPVDPAVQFASGGTTYSFLLPENSTLVPALQIQTGTLPGSITVTLDLQANGQDVTPASLQPVVIIVPNNPPVITSMTLARSGDTITVTVQGYSSTRDMVSADFTFTPATGQTLSDPSVTVDVSSEFATWYADATSLQYGSAFSYTQTFDLSSDASTVGSVSVTMTNSVGTSSAVTTK